MVIILCEILQKLLLGELRTHDAGDWRTQLDTAALDVKQIPKQKSRTECGS